MNEVAIYIGSSEYEDYLQQADRISRDYTSTYIADAREIRRLLGDEDARLLQPIYNEPGPPNPDSTLLMVLRVVPRNLGETQYRDYLKWLFRRFKAWRLQANRLPTAAPKSIPVANPFARGFDGVLGNHPVANDAEIDFSVPFGDDPGKILRSYSFLQFYDDFDLSDWDATDARAPLLYLRLVRRLLEKYFGARLGSKYKRWGTSTPTIEGRTVVLFDESVDALYHELHEIGGEENDPSNVDFRPPAPVRNAIPELVHDKAESKLDAVVIVVAEKEFEKTRSLINASLNATPPKRKTFFSGRNDGVNWGPNYLQYVRIDPNAGTVTLHPNAVQCPGNLFVVWDCIWEAMLRASAKRGVSHG